MTNEEMLEKVRRDRPNQVIHEVIDFEINNFGFYDVRVDMETLVMDTKIKHCVTNIPYPLSEYNKLSNGQQFDYRWKYII